MSTTKKYVVSVLFSAAFATKVFAIIGSELPEGPAGDPPGSTGVTAGGSISPYSANAARSVTDLVVAGSVSYPLEFSRISNSRVFLTQDNSVGSTVQNADFGTGGDWLRS